MNLAPLAQARLIVFTRYPEPGQAKTRLIPVLGALGAATVHRQMTEHTLLQVRKLHSTQGISIAVHFDGNGYQQMQDWLGADLVYQSQPSGDLGWRMARSFDGAFQAGVDSPGERLLLLRQRLRQRLRSVQVRQRVAIIGTDCPGLNAELMGKAFDLLLIHDLVIGPAIDGGYYLIGLRYFIPELFVDISWSTDRVLVQTVAVAHKLNLSVGYLPILADVDRPEDLPVWEQIGLNS